MRRRRKFVLWACGLAIAMLLLVVGSGLAVEAHLVGQLGRIPNAFSGLDSRPAASGNGSMNVLVVEGDAGSPSQAAWQSWPPGMAGSATVLLVHFDSTGRAPAVVVFPRTTAVEVPGHGTRSIGAVFRLGPPALLVGSVESTTQVHVDHLAVVDQSGFSELAASVHGVDVNVWNAAASGPGGSVDVRHLEGRHIVSFLHDPREPAVTLAGRQAAFLRALMDDTLHQEMRKRPLLLYHFLDTVTRSTSVDEGWSTGSMRGLVWSLRNLRSANISYVVVPVAPASARGTQPPTAEADTLWGALRDDDVRDWLAAHPSAVTPPTVR